MRVFTYSEARQNLSSLLNRALRDGGVRIRRRDGRTFVLLPDRAVRSPFDVEGVPLGLSREEIVSFVREGRARRAAKA
jgi:hypothetical protein